MYLFVHSLFWFSNPNAPVPDGGVSISQPKETSDLEDSSDENDSSDEASSFSDSD